MSLEGDYYKTYGFIPKEFTYGNVPCFFLKASDYSDGKVSVYDEKLELKKELNVYPYVTTYFPYKYERQERDVIVKQVSRKEVPTGLSLQDLLVKEGYYEVGVDDNGDSIVNLNHWNDNYYHPSELGWNYLKKYRVCRNGMVDSVFIDYDYSYSDWRVVESDEGNYTHDDVMRLYYVDANTGFQSDAGFAFSQTLFNQDETFECIVPKYKSIPGVYESYDVNTSETFITKRTVNYYETVFTGFQVMSETGDVLQDIDFETDYSHYDDRAGVLVIGNHTYLVIGSLGDIGGSKTFFYDINRETTKITQVKSVASSLLKIQPTVSNRSSAINVNFGNSNTKGTSLVVSSSSGERVMKKDITAGEQSTQINLNVPVGLYHVTRMDNGKIIENRKIIIK